MDDLGQRDLAPAAPMHSRRSSRFSRPQLVSKIGDPLCLLVLFALALFARQREFYVGLFGDESIYFYLSKTLGGSPASAPHLPPLSEHVAARPFNYLFFYPWAQLGFNAFRSANLAVGCMVPCLVFLLSRHFRVSTWLALVVALITVLHPTFIRFSVVGFPDMLATSLVLSAYLAYFSSRLWLAALLLLLTVLAKEAFAMFLLPLIVLGALDRLRHKRWTMVGPLLALSAVVISNGIAIFVLHGRQQGWSTNPVTADFFCEFLFSYWFIPALAVLLLHKEREVFSIAFGAPVFFAIWGHVLHRGVVWWYVIGPLAIAMVAVSVALQRALTDLSHLVRLREKTAPLLERARIALSCTLLASVLIAATMAPGSSGIASLRLVESVEALTEPGPLPGSGTTDQVVAFLESEGKVRELVLVDSFWGYPYYPFSSLADHVDNFYTADTDDVTALSHIAERLKDAQYIVWGKSKKRDARHFTSVMRGCMVFSNREHFVYRLNAHCKAAIVSRPSAPLRT